ncbi:hypothetical protein PROFUN_07198 [Planoprotostelium fungivorum]|uniref:Uncharacterized protein n=1 Tax=Planoprotostelium fungivorum TaxID=1890364 RepID=A0A2P6NME3_9EUKA|nr:hypothetical protein PROFUN_07198 [Planoprotostelium fungivorum]
MEHPRWRRLCGGFGAQPTACGRSQRHGSLTRTSLRSFDPPWIYRWIYLLIPGTSLRDTPGDNTMTCQKCPPAPAVACEFVHGVIQSDTGIDAMLKTNRNQPQGASRKI